LTKLHKSPEKNTLPITIGEVDE